MDTPDTEKVQELETEQFGTNHAEIGAALLAIWGIPPKVVNAIAYHHKPQDDAVKELSLSTILHIANAIAYMEKSNAPEGSSSQLSHLMNQELIASLGLEAKVSQWLETPVN